jgi:hypothetical protein
VGLGDGLDLVLLGVGLGLVDLVGLDEVVGLDDVLDGLGDGLGDFFGDVDGDGLALADLLGSADLLGVVDLLGVSVPPVVAAVSTALFGALAHAFGTAFELAESEASA